uniref:Uncharacterized protein n=1 Tax=Pararge aegeria TaxID=116150 RepID=S4P6M2_9NEOP
MRSGTSMRPIQKEIRKQATSYAFTQKYILHTNIKNQILQRKIKVANARLELNIEHTKDNLIRFEKIF